MNVLIEIVVQSLSCVQLLWPCGLQHARLSCLHLTVSWGLLRFMSIELMMLSNHLILCHPLLLSSVFPSIRVFSNESALHSRWPKYWSFSFSISPSNEYSGLISFRIDWFDFLPVQGDSRESSPASQFKSINSLVLIGDTNKLLLIHWLVALLHTNLSAKFQR